MNLYRTNLACAALALAATFSVFGTKPAAACSSTPYIGSVCTTAASYCPDGYAEANGAVLPISDYQALFSLMGNYYGGDGRNTFGLPDLRGRSPVGVGQGPALTSVTFAQQRGAESVALDITQMPQHTHEAEFVSAGANTLGVTVKIPVVAANADTNVPGPTTSLGQSVYKPNPVATSPVNSYSTATTTTTLAPFNAVVTGATSGGTVGVGNTGGNPNTGQTMPFGIIPPQSALMFCIAISGEYPPRPSH
jgi:microcystin-dependent protein